MTGELNLVRPFMTDIHFNHADPLNRFIPCDGYGWLPGKRTSPVAWPFHPLNSKQRQIRV
jgi:hypothetical protein